MKSFLILFVFVAMSKSQLLIDDPNYCYTKDPVKPQQKEFGTVTPYDNARGNVLESLPISSCKPGRFWFQGRHGSRYPSAIDNDQLLSADDTLNKRIVNNFVSMKTTLCDTDAKGLNEWTINPNFTLSTAAPLTETGRLELKAMGQRFRKAFPKLLPAKYSPTHYYFRRTPVPRTLESAQAFASGIFGEGYTSQVIYDGGVYPELYLLPWNNCSLWSKAITSMPEYEAFAQSAPYKQMINQVNKKLGFTGTEKLTNVEINKMITHCKYEQLYDHVKPSPFCAAFSPANFQVSEYNYDLLFYYVTGYGFTQYKFLFENMGCQMVQAMLKFLQSSDPNEEVAKLWFGHDLSLHFVFNALGLYKDDIPLRSGNFAQQTDRKWKTGFLTPMAGNIAAIRYDCPNGDDDVLFLHNERPMQIPGCSTNGMCKLTTILNTYKRFLYANCPAIYCTNEKLK